MYWPLWTLAEIMARHENGNLNLYIRNHMEIQTSECVTTVSSILSMHIFVPTFHAC